MILFGIVGWKNSGKTFFAEKLIKYFSQKKMNVASIKHAHHDFDIDKPGTDSYLHRKSGSNQVIISSSKRWVKIEELKNQEEKKLEELIGFLNSPDVVIIEGFKNSPYPKIEIIKENNEDYLFLKLNNVVALITDKKIDTSLPQFNKIEIKRIAEFILNQK